MLLHGLRMLTISGSSVLADSAFLRAKVAVMKLLKIMELKAILEEQLINTILKKAIKS